MMKSIACIVVALLATTVTASAGEFTPRQNTYSGVSEQLHLKAKAPWQKCWERLRSPSVPEEINYCPVRQKSDLTS